MPEESSANSNPEAEAPKPTDEIREKHESLKGRLADLIQKRDFFASHVGDDFIKELVAELDQRVEEAKEDNITPGTKADNRVRNDGRVMAYREMRWMLKGKAWDHDIEGASEKLDAFEKENALLLYGAEQEEKQADVVLSVKPNKTRVDKKKTDAAEVVPVNADDGNLITIKLDRAIPSSKLDAVRVYLAGKGFSEADDGITFTAPRGIDAETAASELDGVPEVDEIRFPSVVS